MLLGGVAAFVVGSSQTTEANSGASSAVANAKDESVVGPLDQLSSVDIAVNVARAIDLPEAVAVTNQSDSAKILNAITPADTSVVAKPQIVATESNSAKDIQKYTVQSGDTVSSIAAKFGITSDSIRWSNDLTGNEVRIGTELWIPPVDGIVYTVKVGDTAASIAEKFSANKAQVIAANDAELSGLKTNQRILIPNGQKPAPSQPSYSFFAATYGYNGYDFGYCTWYVATKVDVPANWGHAFMWANGARLTPGWTVSNTPQVGAVAQRGGGLGHVAVVEAVSPDGTMIKYSDMNGRGGWNGEYHSDWVPASSYANYIYR